jgi:hypothetical protein
MTTKTLVNPTELIHHILVEATDINSGENVHALNFAEKYQELESELFKFDLYPQGYHVHVDTDTANKEGMSTLLSNGILSFLKHNGITEFYLDEDE